MQKQSFLFLVGHFSASVTQARSEPNYFSASSWRNAVERRSLHLGELARGGRTAHRDARVCHGLNVGFQSRRITGSQLRRRSGVRPLRRMILMLH